MKKLILSFLLILCACSSKYQKLGYSFKASSIINSLSENDQSFFENYDANLNALLESKDFKVTNIDTYVLFTNWLKADDVIKLVNNKTIGPFNYNVVKKLLLNKNFNLSNIDKYLELYKKIKDADTVIFLVEQGIDTNYDLINKLIKDRFYIVNNLPLYIKYKDGKESTRELVEYVNTFQYLSYYEDTFYADPEKYGTKVLVNKYYYLGSDYAPVDLVKLDQYGYGSLRKEAYDAYVKMYDAAKKDGIDFYVTSSYRSYDTQVAIYNIYLKIDPQEKVDTYSARPGFSDHQSGYTVDILSKGYDFDTFHLTKACKWLKENAYKYGFILRYPYGLEKATGYMYESWHYRYVGDIAEDVYKSGVSYDEFFVKYIED